MAELGNGLHYALSREQYDAVDRLNATNLLWFEVSELHAKAAIDGTLKKTSTDLTVGQAFHCYILERDVFDFHFSVAGTCDAIVGSGTRKGARCGSPGIARDGDRWLCGTHGRDIGREEGVISAEQMWQIEQMAESLKGHPIVKLLRRRGGCEATVLWDCHGVPFKSRLDKLCLGDYGAVIDLKKVRAGHGTKERFSKSMHEYGYAVRAALYCDAVKQVTGEDLPFIFVVCEDSPPWAVGVFQLEPYSMDCGRFLYRSYINRYKRCMETGVWHGWSEKVDEIALPGWVRRELEGAIENEQ